LTSYIESQRPLVIAFNTDSVISDELIDFRIASHPVRLLSNAPDHLKLPQPLVAPASALPTAVRNSLKGKDIRDYGLAVARGEFSFDEKYCVLPSSMTVAYALAFGASGRAAKIELAGFDGYATGDPRNSEVDDFLVEFQKESQTPEIVAITPTRYSVSARSVYSVI
jgi:4-hydroxy 2-oxovalerate aldolase